MHGVGRPLACEPHYENRRLLLPSGVRGKGRGGGSAVAGDKRGKTAPPGVPAGFTASSGVGDKRGRPGSPGVSAASMASSAAGNEVSGAGAGAATGVVDSVRNHQQVVMKHILDHELRMDLAGRENKRC